MKSTKIDPVSLHLQADGYLFRSFRTPALLLISVLFGLTSATANAAENGYTLTTADENGANAWTNTNSGDPQGTFAETAADDTVMKIRRTNAKAHLRFDLSSLDLSGSGTGNLFEQGLRFSDVTLTLEQSDPLRAKPLELHAINLERDWAAENRLGIDWYPDQITHLNAPAGAVGGTFSTSDNSSLLIGDFSQSADFRFHTYSESSEDANTPLLDYLNGIAEGSNTSTVLRLFGISESDGGPRNTDNFFTYESPEVLAGNAMAPTLDLTTILEHSYLDWIGGFELPSGENDREDNPSGDGISNALKYALGLDPRVNSNQNLPVSGLMHIDGQDYLSLAFSRNENALAGLLVETSKDLETWNTDPYALTLVEATPTSLRVRDNVPVSEVEQKFMRLRVEFDIGNRYTDKVMSHLNTLLEHGRDRSGSVHTPLFMAVLDDETLIAPSNADYAEIGSPAPPDRRALGGADLWWQADLMRVLHKMSPLNPDYAMAADEHIAYYLDHLTVFTHQGQDNMLWWGNHLYYDAFIDEPVAPARMHVEINIGSADPMYLWRKMWELRPEETERQIELIWKWCVVDKEKGWWDRQAGNFPYWASGFSQAGASYIRAFAIAYEATGDAVWKDRAEALRDHMWSQRNPETNLIPAVANVSEVRDNDDYWRRNFSSSQEPGNWVPALLAGYQAFGDEEWTRQAEAIMQGYLVHAFDSDAGRFYRWIRIDGVYDTNYPTRWRPFADDTDTSDTSTVEGGYSSFWRDDTGFRVNSPIAIACLDAFEVLDRPFLLEGAKIIGDELLESEPRSDTGTGGSDVGAWAVHYASAIDILIRLHRFTGSEQYLDRAIYIAEDAVDYLWNAETKLFRGHSRHGYEVADGTDKFVEQLVRLDYYIMNNRE